MTDCSHLDKHVCMVVHEASAEEEIEVGVDSGADASRLLGPHWIRRRSQL